MNIYIEKIDEHAKNKKFSPSKEQWQAIATKGCDILVSAAAGSGKTEVLSERIARKVACEKWDIDRLLVLTFTTAAAKNMQVRIENKIEQRLTEKNSYEDYMFLKRQRLLMSDSNISTIDSFCLEILKKFYYLVEEEIYGKKRYLSPSFKLLTDNSMLLKESAEQVIEKLIDTDKEGLDVLFEIYKDKKTIVNFIINIYQKLLTTPNYREYIKNDLTKNLFYSDTFIKIYSKIKYIDKNNVAENIKEIQKAGKELLKIDTTKEKIKKDKLLPDIADFIRENEENIKTDDSLDNKIVLKEFLNSLLLDIKEDKLKEIYEKYLILKSFVEVKAKVSLLNKFLIKIMLELDNYFINKKRNLKFLDFSDLNHLAIKALEKKEGEKSIDTEASIYYKKKFLEIYVDEYQDNNNLQEYILNLVRGENTYFFRVGDVKQSIYGFRGSNPNLFEEKYNSYKKLSSILENYDLDKNYNINEKVEGLVIILKENFRSYENVLKSSNFIFNRLMYKKNAGISYDSENALYYPSVKEKQEKVIPTYIYIGEKKSLIHKIAKEIIEKVEAGSNYNDFAILLRSANNIALYKEIFKKYSIPIYTKEKQGLVNSFSFNIVLNLLRFLDNTSLDYSLAAILHSKIFRFSNEDLLKLSMVQGKNLFEKINNSEEEKAKYTLYYLNKWLNTSFNFSAYETIEIFAKDTNFIEYLRTKDLDDEEVDYFENIMDILKDTSETNMNISYSIRILDNIRAFKRYDSKRKEVKNSVTISTIHISKGLEYNYVFISDLEKDVNEKDSSGEIIFSNELGVSINESIWQEGALNKNYSINSKLINKKNYQEEIRNLYVALTRAVKGIYLVSSEKINLGKGEDEKLNKEQILTKYKEAKNYSDMINIVLNNYDNEEITDKTEENVNFKLLEVEEVEEKEENKEIDFAFLENKEPTQEEVKNLEQYYYKEKKFIPSKTSYSAIRKQKENSDKNKDSKKKEEYLVFDTISKKNKTVDAILKGNTIHKLFEKIVLDAKKGIFVEDEKEYVKNLLQTSNIKTNIIENRILTEKEYEIINNEKDYSLIKGFINSEVFSLIKNCKRAETEIPFTLFKEAKEIFEDEKGEEKIILQGVIDLLVHNKDDSFIVIDYKTDKVNKKTGTKLLIDRHKEQLNIYKDAVEKYYKSKKIDTYVYSYVLEKLIKIN